MIRLEDMSREELLEVIRMKDALMKELKEEISCWQQLVDELQHKFGVAETPYTGNGD